MICVGLLTTIRISGTTVLRGWVVVDAELGSGIAGLELVGAPCDFGLGLGARCGGAWNLGLGAGCVGAWSCCAACSLRLGAGLGARRKSEHRSQNSNA